MKRYRINPNQILVVIIMLIFLFEAQSALASLQTPTSDDEMWQYERLEDGNIRITGYADQDINGKLIIPSTIEGSSVTVIGGLSFMQNVIQVVLPDSVIELEEKAFYSDNQLRRINLPEGLIRIGAHCFEYCGNMEEPKLPNTLQEIGERAYSSIFRYNPISQLILPGSLQKLGNLAFGFGDIEEIVFPMDKVTLDGNPFGASSIRKFSVPAEHPNLGVYQGVLYDKTEKRLIAYPTTKATESFSIPDGIESIGSYAFAGSHFQAIHLPDSIVAIEDHAFWSSALVSIEIPETVGRIEQDTFSYSNQLTSVILKGAEIVDYGAFSECHSLKTIEFSDLIQQIEPGAFINCQSLENIKLPGEHPVFTIIDGVLFTKADQALILYPSGIEQREYRIPDGIQRIASHSFGQVNYLEKLTVPGTVKIVDDYVFDSNILLGEIGLSEIIFEEGVEELGNSIFPFFNHISYVSLPESLSRIGYLNLRSDTVTIQVVEGSYAEEYCIKENLPIVYKNQE